MKPVPNVRVLEWTREQDASLMFLGVVSLVEIRFGAELLPLGRRRSLFRAWLENELLPHFRGRILPVNEEIALDCGRLMAQCKSSGHTVDPLDALLAATARMHGLSVVTLNQKHFARLQVPLVEL